MDKPIYSQEAEQAVLAILISNNKKININDVSLEVDDFYREHHRKAFSVISEMVENGEPVDLVTLSEKITPEESASISECCSDPPLESRFDKYVSILKEKTKLRKIQRLAVDLRGMVEAGSVDDALERINLEMESFNHHDRRKRGIQGEVERIIGITRGLFSITDIAREAQITPVSQKTQESQLSQRKRLHAIRVALSRLAKEGVIERVGERDGVYRRVEKRFEVMDFLNAPTTEFPLNLPLGVHRLCKLYPGNIVVLGGSKSAGKTAFLLNIVKDNMGLYGRKSEDIVYLNSEMGSSELRIRLELFTEIGLSAWRFQPVTLTGNWADAITGEKKIFIIDYLEITDNFWRVAEEINNIHKKLKEGICIIAIQKEAGRDTARGGSFSSEKARLYLSLDRGKLKIFDAKAWRDKNNNPRGQVRSFKLANGSIFLPQDEWHDEEKGG